MAFGGENRHSVARKRFIINEISSVRYLALVFIDSDPTTACLSCFIATNGEKGILIQTYKIWIMYVYIYVYVCKLNM